MSWGPWAERFARFVALPHLWISGSLAAVLIARALKVRVWPRERHVIELLAYGAGLYGGVSLLSLASEQTTHVAEMGFSLCAGGAVVILAAARGAYGVIYSIQPAGRAPPEDIEPDVGFD